MELSWRGSDGGDLLLAQPANHKTGEIQKLKEKKATQIYEREPADPMEDLDVNAAICGIYVNTNLVQDYEVN